MAPRRRKTRAAASSSSQQSLSVTQVTSPLATSSPQTKPLVSVQEVGQKLIKDIKQRYNNMHKELDELKPSLIMHISEDMVYSSIYDKVETEQPSTFIDILKRALERTEKLKRNEIKNENIRAEPKLKKLRRSKSEEINEKNENPKASIQRSRSRNYLDVSQQLRIQNTTYRVASNHKSFRETRSVYGSSYKIADVTPGPFRQPTMYRKPLAGEHIISMSGSPILVQTDMNRNETQMQIPGKDGKVYAIMTEHLENITDFPSVDQKTISNIMKLQKFLNEKIHE